MPGAPAEPRAVSLQSERDRGIKALRLVTADAPSDGGTWLPDDLGNAQLKPRVDRGTPLPTERVEERSGTVLSGVQGEQRISVPESVPETGALGPRALPSTASAILAVS